jgi:hypothetical protein
MYAMIHFFDKINTTIYFLLVICSDTSVVAPLETLNTNLNYKILDEFIGKVTDLTTKFLIVNPVPSNISNSVPSTPPILIPYG